jgi:hypothetical protein
MRRRTGLLLLAAITVAVALAGGLVWATHSDSAEAPNAPVHGNSSLAAMKGFTKFPLYDAGSNVRGLPLTGVQYADGVVTFTYGDCAPPPGSIDGGCTLPVSIQVWNACSRNPASYKQDMLSPIGDEKTVRGVPAASFEAGYRLEVQTGRSTVVIFAENPSEIASELQGVNNKVPSHVDLPAPAEGAMSGKLRC